VTDHIQLIGKKLDHLQRMRAYLGYSLEQARRLIPMDSWESTDPRSELLNAVPPAPTFASFFN
jgi:hypothetical protein